LKTEKIDRLKEDLERAKEKANVWQARVRDLEKQITECENMNILRMVRDVAASPEELKNLLSMLQAVKNLPADAGAEEAEGADHED